MSEKDMYITLFAGLILLMSFIPVTCSQEYLFAFVYKSPYDYEYSFDIDTFSQNSNSYKNSNSFPNSNSYVPEEDMGVPSLSSPNPTSQERFDDKVEPNNPLVREKALQIAATYPGEYSIDQVCAIVDYFDRWRYVSDPAGHEYVNYANESIRAGKPNGYAGIGDCDDRAVLLASLIEAIGGTTRILHACDEDSCHAYPEVYIGTLCGDSYSADETPIGGIMWRLIERYNKYSYYNPMNIHCRETRYTNGDNQICRGLWLNLDYGRPGNSHFDGYLCSVSWSGTSNHAPTTPNSQSAYAIKNNILWRQNEWNAVGSGNKGRPDYEQGQVRDLISSDAEWAARGSGNHGRPG